MTTKPPLSVTRYESFNARNYPPEMIAETFVAPDDYWALWGHSHTVLMGPRGSGKTTLFKMLTLRALHAWRDRRAADVLGDLPFHSIYIPTDIHWHRQIEVLERIPGSAADALREVPVTTNILIATAEAIEAAVALSAADVAEAERAIAEELYRHWLLRPSLPLLEAVKHELRARMNEVGILLNAAKLEQSVSLPGYVGLNYLAAVGVAISACHRHLPQDTSWALCFDELELAPAWLQDRLFSDLRSTDQRFLFKLSTSPVPALVEQTEAAARHDFDIVRLWPHRAKSLNQFSEELANSFLQRRDGPRRPNIRHLLGQSPFAAAPNEYERGSHIYGVMKELAQIDAGFRDVLRAHEIDHRDPCVADVERRDQVLRKAKPLALVRHAFLKAGSEEGSLTRRSRKRPHLYYGWDILLDLCDGNPRWLIGLLNDLLATLPVDADLTASRIEESRQEVLFLRLSEHFLNLIKTIPAEPAQRKSGEVSLVGVIVSIGEHFQQAQIDGRFSLDPSGSVEVDMDVPLDLWELIRTAVYHGAMILTDPSDDVLETSPVGKRFRLAYLLAPFFGLPLRLYGSVNLSSMLSRIDTRPDPLQGELPL